MITAVSVAACGGLFAGGWVTVLADRISHSEALSLRFRCGSCKTSLTFCEIVPLLSWLVLRGRCRHCATRVSVMYPTVEVTTAGLWVAVTLRFGWGWSLLPPLVLVVSLTALSVVDLYSYRLPDRLVFSALGWSIAAMLPVAVAGGDLSVAGYAVVGMFVYFGFLLVVHLISPRGLGFGDVKLSLLLGLHLGWVAGIAQGDWGSVVRLVFWAQLVASLIGVVGGLSLGVVRRNLKREVLRDPEAESNQPARLLAQSFPFGPALACATMIVVLFAESVPAL